VSQPVALRHWLPEFILLASLWGASFLFMRISATEFGAFPTAGLRVMIAALCLMPLVYLRGHGAVMRQHWGKILFLGTINAGFPFAFYAYALLSIPTGLTALINATVPLFGALIAWLWLKDRPHGLKILGLLLGFLGVALLAIGKGSLQTNAQGYSSALGIMASLGSCLLYGISASFTRRYLTGVNALTVAAGSLLGAALVLAVPTLWLWPSTSPSWAAWMAALTAGVLCTGLAYVLFFRLIEKLGAATALTVTFLIPVFAVIYGMLFLGEMPSAWMLLCAPIIMLGTALSLDVFKRRPV
jgi:drug/metabolite transporter (DMT)-like permease